MTGRAEDVSRRAPEKTMAKSTSGRKRNKSSRHRAKLAAKHNKQRMRARSELTKRKAGGRLGR